MKMTKGQPTEVCESCSKLLFYGKGQIIWTIDEIPLCARCAKELAKESE